VGVSPDGTFEFLLPRIRLQSKFDFRDRALVRPMVLDAVVIDADEAALTLVWRACVAVGKRALALESVVVRELEDWEDGP